MKTLPSLLAVLIGMALAVSALLVAGRRMRLSPDLACVDDAGRRCFYAVDFPAGAPAHCVCLDASAKL